MKYEYEFDRSFIFIQNIFVAKWGIYFQNDSNSTNNIPFSVYGDKASSQN